MRVSCNRRKEEPCDENRKMGMLLDGWKQEEVRIEGESELFWKSLLSGTYCMVHSAVNLRIVLFPARRRLVMTCIG